MSHASVIALSALSVALLGCGRTAPGAASSGKVRVAVIGGMVETGFWQALAERFQQETNQRLQIEIVATGPKHVLGDAFRRGAADLVTMHACDTIVNLVADGYARNPQPWLKNDLVIVGPSDDPAHIRNTDRAAEAFRKIVAARAPFVVHASLGAQEVMREILHTGDITLPSEQLTILFTDRARDVLKIAAEKHAYTLVGRIPFLSGKLPNEGLQLMVRGDPELRRPYVVATVKPGCFRAANVAGAEALAAFLLEPATQAWIASYGVGQLDKHPLFFPVAR